MKCEVMLEVLNYLASYHTLKQQARQRRKANKSVINKLFPTQFFMTEFTLVSFTCNGNATAYRVLLCAEPSRSRL